MQFWYEAVLHSDSTTLRFTRRPSGNEMLSIYLVGANKRVVRLTTMLFEFADYLMSLLDHD